MNIDRLSSFYLVYKSSPSFWSNYAKGCSWLKDQGFKPVTSPFKCPNESPSSQLIVNLCNQINLQCDDFNSISESLPVEESDSTNSEVTVDDDYIRFILETRKHQKERAQLKAERIKMEENEEIIYKDICEIDQQRLIGSLDSGRKKCDYINLYGCESDTIKGKEALLQSDFNVYCDTHKPQFWPTIPIKI